MIAKYFDGFVFLKNQPNDLPIIISCNCICSVAVARVLPLDSTSSPGPFDKRPWGRGFAGLFYNVTVKAEKLYYIKSKII